MPTDHFPYDVVKFTHQERLDDRYLTVQLHFPEINQFGHAPAEPDLVRSRSASVIGLGFLIEIANPWHPTAQLGQQVINNTVREFFRSDSPSTLVRFEQALKVANDTITHIETRLNSFVSGAAVLFDQEQIHFSTVGSGHIILIRHGDLSDVSAASTDRVFATVTSGDLTESDLLVLANQPMVESLNQIPAGNWQTDDFRRLITDLTAGLSTDLTKKQAAVLLHYQPGPDRIEETIYWEKLEPHIPLRLPRVSLPAINLSGIRAVGNNLKIAGLNLSRVIGQTLRERRAKSSTVTKPELKQPIGTLQPTGPVAVVRRLPSLPPLPKLKLKRYQLLRFVPVVIFAILLVFGIRLIVQRIKQAKTIEAKPPTLVEQLEQQPATSLISFLGDHFSFNDYTNLSESDKQRFQELLLAHQITVAGLPTVTNELPQPVAALASAPSFLFALDQAGQLWKITPGSPPVKLDQATQIQQPISLVAVSDTKTVASDQSGNVWLFDSSPPAAPAPTADQPNPTAPAPVAQPTALSLPNTLPSGPKALAFFDSNLYLLNLNQPTIYRVAKFDKDLAGVTTYVKNEIIGLPAVSDWGINNQIVVIDPAGKLKSFQRNQAGKLNLTVTVTKAPKLATNAKNTDLFIASDRVISRYSSTGELKSTTFLPVKDPITALAVDQAGQQLWLTCAGQLFSLKL